MKKKEKEEALIEKQSRQRICPTLQIKAKWSSRSKITHNQGAVYEVSMKTGVEDVKRLCER